VQISIQLLAGYSEPVAGLLGRILFLFM